MKNSAVASGSGVDENLFRLPCIDEAEQRLERRVEQGQQQGGGGKMYRRFAAMIGTSTAVMFVLMYTNTYSIDHVFWSETRFWMAFVMGACMAVIMLLFMWGMFKSTTRNAVILGAAALVFAGALFLVRSQKTIEDTEYMQAMIPHHSIAIMTSERARIRDPRVRELAKNIIVAQRREIAEMKYLIEDIQKHGVRTAERMPREFEVRPVAPLAREAEEEGGQ